MTVTPGAPLTVVGRGPVGQAIATLAAGAGWRVTTTGRAARLTADGPVVVAIPGSEVSDLLTRRGRELAGRVVIDATNRLAGPPWIEGMTTPPYHQREVWRELAPEAMTVRAFCTLGVESLRSAYVDPPLHVWCGPEPGRQVTEPLIRAAGHEPAWLGESDDAFDEVDAAARLWFAIAVRRGWGRELAFAGAVVREPAPAAADGRGRPMETG